MGFTCGIIGLPNVGKSTIFNALTSAKAEAANYPFCTIDPNTGVVSVPDERLMKLANLAQSAKIVPAQITFLDIAGLIRGASKGEGLGNQFLGHIRGVDAVAHVIRCFEDPNVVHVDGAVDPVRDIDTIDTELVLADLDSIQKQASKLERMAKQNDKDAKLRYTVAMALESHLGKGLPARMFTVDAAQEGVLAEFAGNLLTAKPVLFVGNVSESEAATEPDPAGSRPIDRLAAYAKSQGTEVVVISGKVEAEIAELAIEERADYLESIGLERSGLDRLILAGYRLLNLITFFTVGPKEAHAWTVRGGSSAPQSAGKIHTDFERGFIRAEVIGYDDFVAAGTEVKAKEAGKMRLEGKEYVTRDGDVMHFRFSV